MTVKNFASLLIALIILTSPTVSARELWVASNGNDRNPGTKDQPLATPGGAQQLVRQWIKAGLKEDATVWYRGGTYRLESPWMCTAEDSPGAKHSVTYAACPGESVTISGGRRIEGWQPTDAGPWKCQLPDVAAGKWHFRQLLVNGRRATRARYPNLDEPHPFVHIRALDPPKEMTSSRLLFQPEQLAAWSQPDDAEIVILGSWEIIRKRLSRVDPTKGTVELASPHIVNHISISPKAGMACYFENAREMLDRPGEWYWDRRSGELLYWPLPGEDVKQATIEAPVAVRLLELRGTRQQPVENIHFRGLRFENADWPLPKLGYYGLQACFHNTINMKGGEDDSQEQSWTYVDPAIRWEYAANCSLRDGAIQHLGGGGVSVGIGCRDNVLEGNLVADVGANGIMVGEPWAWRYEQDRNCKIPPEDVARNNRVTNNRVRNCGVCYHGGVGIWDGFTDATTIAHNEVHSLPYTGISVGFLWRDWPTVCRNNRVEFNHVYDVVNWLGDSGGIYMLGSQPDTVVRGNLVHAVGYSTQSFRELIGGRGIYFDQGSTGFRVENNVVYDVPGPAMYFNTGKVTYKNHTWADNSFIDTRPKTGEGRWGKALWGGYNNYLEVDHNDRLDPPAVTVEAWFFQKLHTWNNNPKDSRDWLLSKNGNEHQDGHYSLLVDGDRIGAYLNIGGGVAGLYEAWNPKGAWQLHRWHHAAMTYDGSTLRVYLDGKPVAETAVGKPRMIGNGVLTMTRRPDGFRDFGGALDEVRIFARALPVSEIEQHAKATGPLALASDSSLAGYWSFDEIPAPPPAAGALLPKIGPKPPDGAQLDNARLLGPRQTNESIREGVQDSLCYLKPVDVKIEKNQIDITSGPKFRLEDCRPVLYWRPKGEADWRESKGDEFQNLEQSPDRQSFGVAFEKLHADVTVRKFIGDQVWRLSGKLTDQGTKPVELARFHYLDGTVPDGLTFLELLGPREQPTLRSGQAAVAVRADMEQLWKSMHVQWPQLAEPIYDQAGAAGWTNDSDRRRFSSRTRAYGGRRSRRVCHAQ